jgi:hypothetical protein
VPRFMKSIGAVVFASFLAFCVTGCSKGYKEKVVGVWEWNIAGATLLVTINKDGTGSLKGPVEEKKVTWRIQRGNNFIFNDGSKDSGFVIESANENTIQGSDPQAPAQKIVWTRKK